MATRADTPAVAKTGTPRRRWPWIVAVALLGGHEEAASAAQLRELRIQRVGPAWENTNYIARALEFMGVPKEEIAEQSRMIINGNCESLARLLEDHDKPIVGYTWRNREDGFIKGLLDRGVPVFPGPERAIADLRRHRHRGRGQCVPGGGLQRRTGGDLDQLLMLSLQGTSRFR